MIWLEENKEIVVKLKFDEKRTKTVVVVWSDNIEKEKEACE